MRLIGEVLTISEAIRDAGGRGLLVGGCVRDRLLGLESKDYDIEAFGIAPDELRLLLERVGRVNAVGEQFAVYKVIPHTDRSGAGAPRIEIDVSIPRRESKSGKGHRGFVIEGDPWMTLEEASRRRDFTINAIFLDPLSGEYIDPSGGREDLKNRILKCVDRRSFGEDSLRVLRAVRLAARFEMQVDSETLDICRSISLSDLPRERIRGEIERLLLTASRPSIGIRFALEALVLDKLFPALAELSRRAAGTDFQLTCESLDSAVRIVSDLSAEKRLSVMLATLLARAGVDMEAPDLLEGTRSGIEEATGFLDALGLFRQNGYDVRSSVFSLLRFRFAPLQIASGRVSDGDCRRLSSRVEPDLLYRMSIACCGHEPARGKLVNDFIERMRLLGVERGAPEPLLKGRHLIETGMQPGPGIGRILEAVYQRQLDGEISNLDEARELARELAGT